MSMGKGDWYLHSLVGIVICTVFFSNNMTAQTVQNISCNHRACGGGGGGGTVL